MSPKRHSPALRFSIAACRLLLRLYPRRTRLLFAEELHDINESMLEDAYASGGVRAIAILWPGLLKDFGEALAMEFLDAWRTSRCNPAAVATACLVAATAVWSLIIAASAFESRVAARVLDLNLTVTMSLAFGLPIAALLASRVRLPAYSSGAVRQTTLFRTSLALTLCIWSLLCVHLM